MATKVTALGVFLSKSTVKSLSRKPILIQSRNFVKTDTGAILERPEQVRFGLVKVMSVVIPFLWAGATVSKNGAAFLEENEIFIPDDDDD